MSLLLNTVFKGIDIKDKTILEAGCGAGTMTGFLLSRGAAKVIAVSNRREDLDYCRDQLSEDQRAKVDFVEGNLLNLPQIASSSVDMVTAYFLFNVINPMDAGTITREMKRFLKPGGLLAIIDYTPFDYYSDETSRIQRELWNLENAVSVLHTGEKTYYEYSPDRMAESLVGEGFEIVKTGIPIEKVLWKKKLLRDHGDGIREQIRGIKPEKIREGFNEKLTELLIKAGKTEIYSGQIFSIISQS